MCDLKPLCVVTGIPDAQLIADLGRTLLNAAPEALPALKSAIVCTARAIIDEQVLREGRGIEFYDGSAETLRDVLRLRIPDYQRERAGIVLLDWSRRVIDVRIMAVGNLGSVNLSAAEISRAVIAENAASVIAWHTHPGRSALPSENDIEHAGIVLASALVCDYRVLDIVILSQEGAFFSYAKEGLLDRKKLQTLYTGRVAETAVKPTLWRRLRRAWRMAKLGFVDNPAVQ